VSSAWSPQLKAMRFGAVFISTISDNYLQGSHQPGKPRKVGESGKSQGKCVLPVVCYRDRDGHRISVA